MTDTELLDLARTFGTPLYLFDERSLRSRVETITQACPDRTELCFAIKANPFVVPQMATLVPRLEVCSPGELSICESCDIDPDSIVVSGVYKDPVLMDELVAAPKLPHRFTIESLGQLELLHGLAVRHARIVPVLIRLTSGNQFGIDAETLREVIDARERYPNLAIKGVQFFSGTQKSGPRRIVREIERLDEMLGRLELEYGWRAEELEYGPGLPVAYFSDDAFDEQALLDAMGTALANLRFPGKVTLEVGRSLVAACGTYLTRVVDTKCNRGQRYAIVDGGIHHLVYYGQSMAMRQPPCRILQDGSGDGGAECETTWNVFGSLCTVNDILAKQLPLAGLEPGRIIAFEQVGAYSRTEGISLFLSRDLPAVVTVGIDGAPRLSRAAVPTHPFNTPYC